nr:EOG090X03LH [Eurycercus lamellatus]
MAKSRNEFGVLEKNYKRDNFCDIISNNSSIQQSSQQFTTPNAFATSDEESSFSFVLADVSKPSHSSRSRREGSFVELARVDVDGDLRECPSTMPSKYYRSELSFNLPSNMEPKPPPRKHRTSEALLQHNPITTPLIDLGSPPHSPFNKSNNEVSIPHQSFQYNVPAAAAHSSRSGSRLIDSLTSPSNLNSSDSLAQEFSQLASDLHDAEMESGCLVEVNVNGRQHYGVVRWSGRPKNSTGKSQFLVGVELENDVDEGTDGSYLGHQYFRCAHERAVFVSPRQCKLDSRFGGIGAANDVIVKSSPNDIEHGGPDCPSVPGEVAPVGQFGDWSKLTGKFRGIQGHHNSCYLDATLFSMFAFTSIFDGLLFRPPTRDDITQYEEVQRILREDIVNPLRQQHYVRADKVMKLRRLLQKLGSVTGLTNEEKDPEEFLHCLLSQTLRAEPFLKLSSGQEAYHHQLFVEKDDKLFMPSVQQLFEQSFLSSGIKLKEVPPSLIIQMPRFGKSYKMYPYVLPSSLLDITDVLENSPRQCIVCGHLAEMECQQCLGQCGTGLESIAFCTQCLIKVHKHKKRTTHQAEPLQVPGDFAALQEHCVIPRVYLELFAVVCIATSHYVAFVKCGPGPDAPWCFFDSMADRKGEQNGYNVPEVVACPDLPRWLSDDWDKHLLSTGGPNESPSSNNHAGSNLLPDHVRRLFSDAYMCLYQSPDLMLYR